MWLGRMLKQPSLRFAKRFASLACDERKQYNKRTETRRASMTVAIIRWLRWLQWWRQYNDETDCPNIQYLLHYYLSVPTFDHVGHECPGSSRKPDEWYFAIELVACQSNGLKHITKLFVNIRIIKSESCMQEEDKINDDETKHQTKKTVFLYFWMSSGVLSGEGNTGPLPVETNIWITYSFVLYCFFIVIRTKQTMCTHLDAFPRSCP